MSLGHKLWVLNGPVADSGLGLALTEHVGFSQALHELVGQPLLACGESANEAVVGLGRRM